MLAWLPPSKPDPTLRILGALMRFQIPGHRVWHTPVSSHTKEGGGAQQEITLCAVSTVHCRPVSPQLRMLTQPLTGHSHVQLVSNVSLHQCGACQEYARAIFRASSPVLLSRVGVRTASSAES
ncbi:hypothetical protein NDU88_001971 [Pleurodeles waltl]|uniref:Uncharacterized protein n=1 Tax=Pleurodeles waltl TaxID=8319 RepID=A0AAV7LB14_PLEWA|nr:hypothetical protein NDU88_001971 [Pleurodeles waltl]